MCVAASSIIAPMATSSLSGAQVQVSLKGHCPGSPAVG